MLPESVAKMALFQRVTLKLPPLSLWLVGPVAQGPLQLVHQPWGAAGSVPPAAVQLHRLSQVIRTLILQEETYF